MTVGVHPVASSDSAQSLMRHFRKKLPNLRLHADERLRGAYGATPSFAG